ncbi:GNAT family N-acetyltransferase [Sphingomonas cannabina]|uniref:GNAT family N-acetyltransferase n=1 Tax=Sphingomonas cannabina TaxID=2899123 RepID=UPI001F18FE18|nr:GNAT family N-acetyltransferase [Sphingomonas cannabina]UIJ44285.1 GNAT family N-acetyltransferase [Sphingomonas cannabina]
MRIVPADLDHPAVVALIEHHLREAHRNSPPGSAFALDLSGLRDPALSVFAAWEGETLLGLGALKELAPDHGELKSMRTAPDQLRRGVAKAMLEHLIAEARSRGYRRVSLETGTNDAFAPARAMYEAAGFTPSGPFGDYELTEFNRCYSLAI